MIELAVRVLAQRRQRRDGAIRKRAEARRAADVAHAVMLEAYEKDHLAERLELARRLVCWALHFAQTREALWYFSLYRRWRIAWDLDIDAEGRLQRAEDAHWFGRFSARLIASPEELAAMYSTNKLRDAVRATEKDFWSQALSKELAHLFLPLGRPV